MEEDPLGAGVGEEGAGPLDLADKIDDADLKRYFNPIKESTRVPTWTPQIASK